MGREFEIWQLERNLLVQRLMTYLVTNSILFLGFVQIRGLWLGSTVALLGLVSCILGAIHFQGIRRRFALLSETEEIKGIEERLSVGRRNLAGRSIVVAFLAVFGIVWIASLVYSLLQWVC